MLLGSICFRCQCRIGPGNQRLAGLGAVDLTMLSVALREMRVIEGA